MVIKLPTHIFNVINSVHKSGIFLYDELKNIESFISYLRLIKEEETANWVMTHTVLYLRGLLESFEIDNSQEAQLKEIHTIPAEKILNDQRGNI